MPQATFGQPSSWDADALPKARNHHPKEQAQTDCRWIRRSP